MSIKGAMVSAVLVLGILSGTLAYSGFVGTATTTVNSSASFFCISENVQLLSYWSHNTELYVQGKGYTPQNNFGYTLLFPAVTVINRTTSYSGSIVNTLSISNLAPGNALLFQINIFNENSRACTVSYLSLGNLSGNGLVLYKQAIECDEGQEFNVVNQTLLSSSTPGGFYGFVIQNSNFVNDQCNISPDTSITVWFYILLSPCSGNAYEDSHFSLPIEMTLSETTP